MTRKEITDIMQERVLILDGATGTYLQQLNLTEEDFRGDVFREHALPLKGCNDVLCLTKPEAVMQMHRDYVKAGADIIECNSFNANRYSMADYGLSDRVYDIARAAAECARRVADETDRPVIVAGDIGPTSKTTSISADVNNPAAREVTFRDLYEAYREQVQGLMDGGADVYLIETTFDTLNVKAAIKAILDIEEETGRELPMMLSATLSDASGRTLSGQTVEAFIASVRHAHPISIGLNCGFGAEQLRPWLERVSKALEGSDIRVSVHPNAGLPNVMGGYDETPEMFAGHAGEFFGQQLVNVYGGCCGTTPEHIRQMAEVARQAAPRSLTPHTSLPLCTLSGLESLTLNREVVNFVSVGERTNVAGSAKFKRLIKDRLYDEALSVARDQVDNGAQVIDICMDDGLIDGVEAMTTFLNLIASEPEIARVPVMIDSSKWEILEAGLECVQGKPIVNSISLKEGEEKFLAKARHIMKMGAATVVMLFDEQGQADSYERKVSVARRAYSLLQGIGFPTEDIIFDPNVLAVATGMPEHDDYGRAFIEACRTIHQEMPEVHMSGGISNLSFSFRGNNTIRQAMHSVFLYHAMQAGLDMSIVNPAMTTIYSDIPADMLKAVEDVVLNRDAGAAERLIDFAQAWKEKEDAEKAGGTATATVQKKDWRSASLQDRIDHAMLKGITDYIELDAEEAYQTEGSALGVIDHYLMPAMEKVGKLFGAGQMFLPQVVKSARVMKKAVAQIEPYMKAPLQLPPTGGAGGGLVISATVKGDVHDIGKNIVGVVIQCNGYNVVDLGVMVDSTVIVDTAVEKGASAICLSGLITPSLDEMIRVVKLLQQRGLTIPVMLGGATTSALHTAVKIAPEYPDGVVIHCHAAADNPGVIRHLLAEDREAYISSIKDQQRIIRENYAREQAGKTPLLTIEEARRRRTVKDPALVAVPKDEARRMLHTDNRSLRHPQGTCLCCDPLVPLINWHFFFSAWGLKGHFPEILDDPEKGGEARKLYQDAQQLLQKIISLKLLRLQMWAQILPAWSDDDDNIHILDQDGQEHVLPQTRSLKDEPTTHCLADHLLRQPNSCPLRYQAAKPSASLLTPHSSLDYVCPFTVSAGVGLKDLQEQFRKDGDEYHAIMAKLLADRLAEAMAEKLSMDLKQTVGWGESNIRMAFGYPSCPDHSLKRQVFSILGITEEQSGLSLTEHNMINPGETICGLIFANTPTRFFVV